MKPTFLKQEKPLLISMVQAKTPERILELMDLSLADGAEGYGMQLEQLLPAYKAEETYKALFAHAKGLPVYVTNYRSVANTGKSDETLAGEILQLAACGATLCDVMGDLFDPTAGELTLSPAAVKKQTELIQALHEKGAEVLMSSHIYTFTPAERVLEIALEHQARGADISKIVTGASTMEEQLKNLRIITLLKKQLNIPFLFLAGGECSLHRRIGCALGNVMSLGVHEHDALATPVQPLLRHLKAIRDNL